MQRLRVVGSASGWIDHYEMLGEFETPGPSRFARNIILLTPWRRSWIARRVRLASYRTRLTEVGDIRTRKDGMLIERIKIKWEVA